MKRILSLALVLTMILSFASVSAGAKTFTDDSDIRYGEAVDVMTAIGVVDGYLDGSFGPQGLLTRGAAAKIICNLILGPTTASALVADTAPYPDVAANSTFAGYIAYCKQQGIINGYADGSFKPAGPLTGYAFMKMLLGALGYDSARENYTGANWSVQVAKHAIAAGLTDGLQENFAGTRQVKREEAMLYAFNMLQADMVEYDNRSDITVGDIVISTGSKAEVIAQQGSGYADRYEEPAGSEKLQFSEKYFTDLDLTVGADDFGRPANTWTLKNSAIGTYAQSADLTYTAEVAGKVIWSELNKGAFNFHDGDTAVENDEFFFWQDGVEVTSAPAWTISKTETGKIGGQGVLTEVFYDNHTDSVIVTEIRTYAAEVVGDYNADAETLDVTVRDFSGSVSTTLDADEVKGLAQFEDDDIALVTIASDDGTAGGQYVATIRKAEKVTGTVTGYTVNKSVTLGGKAYNYNAAYVASGASGEDDTYTINKAYVAYLDTYGNIVLVENADNNAGEYVFIKEIKNPSGLTIGGTASAAAYFADGTYKVISVDNINGTNADVSASQTHSNKWYTFSEKNGAYELNDADMAAMSGAASQGVVITTNGRVNITTDNGSVKGTNSTIFVVRENDNDVKVYTGIKNVPTFTAAAGGSEVFVVETSAGSTYAKLVFIELDDATVTDASAESSDLVYILDNSDETVSKDAEGNTFYTYDAIVNGKVTTISTSSRTLFEGVGLYTDVEYDEDGYVSAAVALTTSNTAVNAAYDEEFYVSASFDNKTVTENGGILSISDVEHFPMAENAVIYTISAADDTVKTVSARGLAGMYGNGSLSATVFGVMDKGDFTALYIDLGL